MKIVKQLGYQDSIRQLFRKEMSVGLNVVKHNLFLKPKESILIVTDPKLEKVEAAIFFEAAKKITKKIQLISFSGMTGHAQEPPKEVAQRMKEVDTALLVTFYSLSHTQARIIANKAGARIISLPTITKEMILRTLSVNYAQITKLCNILKYRLDKGHKVLITSPAGTNLSLSIKNRQALTDTGDFSKKGSMGNLPAGETFIAPLETKTDGVAVFDGAFAEIELDKPIKVKIRNGKAVLITGGKAAKKLKRLMKRAGKKSQIVCEFGIGTNKTTKLCPEVLEAEKVYGTCHLAFGNNVTFGGKNKVQFHSDGIIKKPTVIIDEKVILKDGKFKIN